MVLSVINILYDNPERTILNNISLYSDYDLAIATLLYCYIQLLSYYIDLLSHYATYRTIMIYDLVILNYSTIIT